MRVSTISFLTFIFGYISGVVSVGRVDTSGLKERLSPDASIDQDNSNAPRWSSFNAPTPGAMVNVATEDDVLETVGAFVLYLLQVFIQSLQEQDINLLKNRYYFAKKKISPF